DYYCQVWQSINKYVVF
nr:immunoglobulin light chain junction region [Macaca mulatta]MOY07827.1 immunoglobulin light chain junction region [Macaca mulatta]MOY09269.1 immunoglobulin light chain junction region [Macaca mulatta]